MGRRSKYLAKRGDFADIEDAEVHQNHADLQSCCCFFLSCSMESTALNSKGSLAIAAKSDAARLWWVPPVLATASRNGMLLFLRPVGNYGICLTSDI